MVPPPKLYVSWQTVLWTPIYIYAPYINPDALRPVMEKYIYTRASDSFLTTIDCSTSPILQTAEILYCDCISVNDTVYAPGACYSSKTAITLGKHLVCRGDEKSVRIGNIPQ